MVDVLKFKHFLTMPYFYRYVFAVGVSHKVFAQMFAGKQLNLRRFTLKGRRAERQSYRGMLSLNKQINKTHFL